MKYKVEKHEHPSRTPSYSVKEIGLGAAAAMFPSVSEAIEGVLAIADAEEQIEISADSLRDYRYEVRGA